MRKMAPGKKGASAKPSIKRQATRPPKLVVAAWAAEMTPQMPMAMLR